MAGDIIVRPVRPDDRAAWEPLWQGYLTFYKSSLAPEVTVTIITLDILLVAQVARKAIGPEALRIVVATAALGFLVAEPAGDLVAGALEPAALVAIAVTVVVPAAAEPFAAVVLAPSRARVAPFAARIVAVISH